MILSVHHASLQGRDGSFSPYRPCQVPGSNEQASQLTAGPATFSIMVRPRSGPEVLLTSLAQLTDGQYAKWLPQTLKLFTSATSLGGVESLAEHRFVSDPRTDKRLGALVSSSLVSIPSTRVVRLSIGLEHLDDLKQDLRETLKAVREVILSSSHR